jgi:hypothetical protein
MLKTIVCWKLNSCCVIHKFLQNIATLPKKQHHITYAVGWLPNYTNTTIYNTTNNEHTQWPFRCFPDWANAVHKYIKNSNKTELHNITLPDTIFKVWKRNVCERISKQPQGCQLLPSPSITWITSPSDGPLQTTFNFFSCRNSLQQGGLFPHLLPVEKKTSLLLSLKQHSQLC